MNSNTTVNFSDINLAPASSQISHKNKSCENIPSQGVIFSDIITIPNCSISDARDLVSDLNNISLFLGSRTCQEDDSNRDLLNLLLGKLQDKIETLDSCLSFLVNAPLIQSERQLKEVPEIESK